MAPKETIQLIRRFPKDGSYPPRLVTKWNSFWLSSTLPVFRDEHIKILNRANKYAIATDQELPYINVNGNPIKGHHVLRDGDLVNYRKQQFIFQEDPVRDARELQQYTPLLPLEYEMDYGLMKRVRIDAAKVTFPKQKVTFRWDRVRGVYLTSSSGRYGFRPFMMTVVYTDEQASKVKECRLDYLKGSQLSDIIYFLAYVVPIDLSIKIDKKGVMDDAFDVLTKQKWDVLKERNAQTEISGGSIIQGKTLRTRLTEAFVFAMAVVLLGVLFDFLEHDTLSQWSFYAIGAGIVAFLGALVFNKILDE